jgi:hypothetical protein
MDRPSNAAPNVPEQAQELKLPQQSKSKAQRPEAAIIGFDRNEATGH